jgi:hypothetical protein
MVLGKTRKPEKRVGDNPAGYNPEDVKRALSNKKKDADDTR